MPQRLTCLLCVLSACFFSLYRASAQNDTLFWFVAPEVTSAHGDSPVLLRLATETAGAGVVIDQPANPAFTPVNVLLGPNGSQSVDLTASLASLENAPANTVLNKGLRIRSNAKISAYYEVNTTCNCNPEIFALKGRNALGTQFIVPFQTAWNSGAGYAPGAFSTIDIVATENNTSITITPTNAVVGHPAGVPYTIVLQQGETYSVQQTGNLVTGTLGGTLITSDKKIAVTIKDDSLSFQGCADLAGDQIVPVNIVGKEYIVVKGTLNVTDKVYIMPVQNNTTISVGGVSQGTFAQGQVFEHNLTTPSIYIQSSAPVYVLHYTGYGCEIGSALVPPITCTGSNSVCVVRSTIENFSITLFTKTANVSGFTLNGNAALIPAAAFSVVPGTGGLYSQALITFSTADVIVGASTVVRNSLGFFHMGIINGGASSGCRYGYFSDFGQQFYGTQIAQSITCNGVSDGELSLNIFGGIPPYTILWSTGDTTQTVSGLPAGNYQVVVTDAIGCADSQQVSLQEPPQLDFYWSVSNPVTCHNGSDGLLTAMPDGGVPPYTLQWSNGVTSPLNPNLSPGHYQVILTDSNHCDTLVLDTLLLNPPPLQTSLSIDDSVLCVGQQTQLTASSADPYTFGWAPAFNLSGTSGSQVTAFMDQDTTVQYMLISTDSKGCSDTLYFSLGADYFSGSPGPLLPEEGCLGEYGFSVPEQAGDSVRWDFGDGSTGTGPAVSHTYAAAGSYTVTAIISDINGCDTSYTQTIQVTGAEGIEQLALANIITPNGDGLNDHFELPSSIQYCGAFQLLVYNRWGEVVQRISDTAVLFDGHGSNGQLLSPGVYFYVLDIRGKQRNGSITIMH
ncbi:MAG: gliding motility-associated C-terminal domain-containing protein [Flavobacteriales bacterium]